MARIVICILVFLFSCQFSSWADENDMSSAAINERLQPIGGVYVGKPPQRVVPAAQAGAQPAPTTKPPVPPGATPAATQPTTPPQATTPPPTQQQPASAQTKPATPSPTAATGDVGEKVYKTYCYVCHAVGAAGAPKFGNAGDWKPRLSQGIPTLIQHAINGYKVMPPRGTCTTCSDADIAAAVKYMLSKSQ